MGARATSLIAPVAAVLALASCQVVPAGSPAVRESPGDFVRHPNGFEVQLPLAPGMADILLVPAGDCVFGFDRADFPNAPNEQLNRAPTSWVGAPGCTRLVPSPRPPAVRDPEPSGALHVHAAVPAGDGGVLGIANYPLVWGNGWYLGRAPAVFRREPDGSIRELARLPMHWLPYPNPDGPYSQPRTSAWGLVRMGERLVVAGADVVDGRVVPVVWTSTDSGAALTALPLPPAPTGGSGQPVTPVPVWIAADGQALLATASSSADNGQLWTWRSTDGGQTWRVSAAVWSRDSATHPGVFSVAAVIRAHGQWLVFGNVQSEPAVLSSPDGAQWTIGDSSGMGKAYVTEATVDHHGDLVVLGQFGGAKRGAGKSSRADACGVVWSGQLGALRRQELGCFNSLERDSDFSTVATIADGRVLITNGVDLWIRN